MSEFLNTNSETDTTQVVLTLLDNGFCLKINIGRDVSRFLPPVLIKIIVIWCLRKQASELP